MKKRRLIYACCFLLIIPIGYSTRKKPHLFHQIIAEYGGDTFWAAMFFFLFRFIFPQKPIWKIGLITYAFAVCIEVSQFYHAPWIDYLRTTFLGKMLLGSGFLWSDILCYAIGVVLGMLLATIFERKTSNIQLLDNNQNQ